MSALRGEIRTLAKQALLAAATVAGDNVFLPRDWPTSSGLMPAVLVQTPKERKDIRSIAVPVSETVTWLELQCQAAGKDPGTVEDQLETLVDECEAVIFGLVVLAQDPGDGGGARQLFRRIIETDYDMKLSSEGATHLGQASLKFAFQYNERFEPVLTDSLTTLDVKAALPPTIRAVTNAATPAGESVLTFAAVPAGVAQGLAVSNLTNPSSIPPDTFVEASDAATVTITNPVAGAGVASGDLIAFTGPVVSDAPIAVPQD